MIIVSTIIVFTILFNQYVIRQFKKADETEHLINMLRNEYSTSTLPIRVIKNIVGQEKTNDLEKEEKLSEAYQKNISLLTGHIDNIDSYLVAINNNLNNTSQMFRETKEERQILLIIINDSIVKMEHFKELLDSKYSASEINRNPNHINELEIARDNLNMNFNNLYAHYENYSKLSRNLLFHQLNFLIIILIILVLLLSLIGIRFVSYDLRFILSSFKQLESHNYRLTNLPKFKRIFKEEKEIYDTVNNIFVEQAYSTGFKEIVMGTYMMDELIDLLFSKVKQLFSVDRVGIAFVDYKQKLFVAEYGVMNYGEIKLGPGFEVPILETSLSKVLETKNGFIANDLCALYKTKPNSKALAAIIEEGIRSNMVVPLKSKNTVFGLVFFSSTTKNTFDNDHFRLATKLLYEIEGFLNRSYLTKVVFSKMGHAFSELVDKKDNETGGHIIRMVKYSVIIAIGVKELALKGYEIDKKTILDIERNASVHDIGKVAVPDHILKKPGKLTSDEWEIMKTHAAVGGDIFKDLRESLNLFDYDFFKVAEEITRYHHEKWDGTGYPEGLKGDSIPLVARIVAVADVFDALTSKRVYKDAFSFDEAVDIIESSKGSHFDPIIVEVFLTVLEEIKVIYNTYTEKED